LPVGKGVTYYYNNNGTAATTSDDGDCKYISESFLSQRNFLTTEDKDKIDKKVKKLNHSFSEHTIGLKSSEVKQQAAICPDYDVNSPFFNSLFTGTKFAIRARANSVSLSQSSSYNRHFYIGDDFGESNSTYDSAKIIGVEDNTKLVAINDYMFSARAGEAEEAFRYEYVGRENKTTEGVNFIRGSFGPYLGITGFE
jgi:hypothetical protein